MITGKKVRLRSVTRADLPCFVDWLNDREVTENLLLYLPLSIEQEESWFDNLSRHPMEEWPLAIERRTIDGWALIGDSSFKDLDWRNRTAEVGIFIGDKDRWGQGYGTEAMQLLLKHGFEDLNLNRIYLYVYETNPRGIRSYEKAGFVHEGRLRQAVLKDGQYVDVLLMSVLRSEWKNPEG